MKLLPFDLEKAQAGHPWGARDGCKGKKIFDTEREGSERLIAILEDERLYVYTIDGRAYGVPDQRENLFLYEEEKIGWVVIYRDSIFGFMASRCLDESGRLETETIRKADGTYLKTVEVRY